MALVQNDITQIKKDMGEIKSDLKAFVAEIRNGYLSKEDAKGLKDDILSLQENNRWIFRTVGGAIIAGAIAFFFAFKQ